MMALFLPVSPVWASIRSMLDLSVFPGKIIVWMLFMLSIVSWVMILSKAVFLLRNRKVDRQFTDRLRQSKTTLEVFEEGWKNEFSLKLLIYLAGAREAAYQLLGSREPKGDLSLRLRQAGKLSDRQLDFLRMAFGDGFRRASFQLDRGVDGLRLTAAFAFLLGAFGFFWTLMEGFDQTLAYPEMAPVVGAALGFPILAIIVAMPPVLGQIAFKIILKKRRRLLQRFSEDISRLFERSFAKPEPSKEETKPHQESAEVEGGPGEESEDSKESRKYHSIRKQLLRSDDSQQELQVNPIARQAALHQ
ncbi:MAG: hypothetical protein CMO55_15270 [Verrucomicrobiales bacterium]|nr:hypothetical protein [Verrucomicrobiales bacterium]